MMTSRNHLECEIYKVINQWWISRWKTGY